MGQSWNGPAVRSVLRILQRPSLLSPSLSVQDISAINISALKKRGIKGIVLDKDNTITAPYSLDVHPQIQASLLDLQRAFPNRKLAILSNSAGTPDDMNFQESKAIEKSVGISVIKHLKKKPDGLEETLQFFQLKPTELAVVGDRLLTDVVFGNLHGMYTIHTQILTSENDNTFARFFRSVENNVLLPVVKHFVVR